jgi:hypothetical protein
MSSDHFDYYLARQQCLRNVFREAVTNERMNSEITNALLRNESEFEIDLDPIHIDAEIDDAFKELSERIIADYDAIKSIDVSCNDTLVFNIHPPKP